LTCTTLGAKAELAFLVKNTLFAIAVTSQHKTKILLSEKSFVEAKIHDPSR